jgi:hypothetical protein
VEFPAVVIDNLGNNADGDHVTHMIGVMTIPTVQSFVPGLQRGVDRKVAVFCRGCDLYVEQPEGSADVGTAVARWNGKRP